MVKNKKQTQEEQYEAFVKENTPVHNVWLNMLKAFLLGGGICVIGQSVLGYCESKELGKDICAAWTSIWLILGSVILTGTGIYPKLAKWGGTGALVPIPLRLRPSNTKKKDKYLASDARFLPLQGR